MTTSEDAFLEREDLQPVPSHFPESLRVKVTDPARYEGKLVKFKFPSYLSGEGTLHISQSSPKGNSLVMIMATNSYPDIATVHHFYLSQDKFEKLKAVDAGFELNL